jgi:hypothetical protein
MKREASMTCEACKSEVVRVFKVARLGLERVCLPCGNAAIKAQPPSAEEKANLKRLRRNRQRRDRYEAMRSLGLVKTPYGWE